MDQPCRAAQWKDDIINILNEIQFNRKGILQMAENFDTPDTDALIDLFTDAIRNKMKATELENEALKMRLNELRIKLELAKAKLKETGIDITGLDFDSEL